MSFLWDIDPPKPSSQQSTAETVFGKPAPKRKPFSLQYAAPPREHDLQAAGFRLLRMMLPAHIVVVSNDAANDAPAVIALFASLTGIRLPKIPSEVYARINAKKRDRGILAGYPDTTVLGMGMLQFIEWKRERVGRLSDDQKELFALLTGAGFPPAICTTPDQALDVLRGRGFPIRGRFT